MQGQLVVVDAIVLATPNFSHLPLISAVFQRTSAHLLIEKPLCTTVEDCLQVSIHTLSSLYLSTAVNHRGRLSTAQAELARFSRTQYMYEFARFSRVS